jgi:hypothetical protein
VTYTDIFFGKACQTKTVGFGQGYYTYICIKHFALRKNFIHGPKGQYASLASKSLARLVCVRLRESAVNNYILSH